jgi:hypothetical protein
MVVKEEDRREDSESALAFDGALASGHQTNLPRRGRAERHGARERRAGQLRAQDKSDCAVCFHAVTAVAPVPEPGTLARIAIAGVMLLAHCQRSIAIGRYGQDSTWFIPERSNRPSRQILV